MVATMTNIILFNSEHINENDFAIEWINLLPINNDNEYLENAFFLLIKYLEIYSGTLINPEDEVAYSNINIILQNFCQINIPDKKTKLNVIRELYKSMATNPTLLEYYINFVICSKNTLDDKSFLSNEQFNAICYINHYIQQYSEEIKKHHEESEAANAQQYTQFT